VIPDVTMAALDMVVMNKKDQNNETKLQNMYKAVDIVAINGIGRSEQELTDNDYTAMENFDYVYYTSPLESIDAFVKDDSQDGYFAQDYDYQADADFIAELIRIYTVSDSALLEEPISDLNKSNMH
jgi:spermidine/putrescine-binding protein